MMWWLAVSWLAALTVGAAGAYGLACRRHHKRQVAALLKLFRECSERSRARARELERMALEDGLTGLHNRRFMDVDLPRELERTRRFGRELTLAILDVDDFKDVNDGHSHQVGDRVLAHLGAILRQACRGMDGVVRYGGDEFVLYFPETTLEEGSVVCQRILERVRGQRWNTLDDGLAITLTIGLASTRSAASVPELLENADRSLQAAKAAGKDRLYADRRSAALSIVA
jgi:diguanylate cyclase (GGDEF)-like protein